MLQRLLCLIIIGSLAFHTEAAHIVGGDMYYACLGNNTYRITLKIYRDCNASGPNVAGFDDPAYIAIYDASGFVVEVVEASLTSGPVRIPPETQNPCLQAPANVCVEEGTYSFDRYLPPSAGGYDVVYIRCCRNATILNIQTPDEVGATYTVHIPGTNGVACNSSPYFSNFPPIVICVNEPIDFNHSAIDPDGDSLVYSLCTPYSGASSSDPQPYPSTIRGPLGFVNYHPGYSSSNALGGNPPLTISSSGRLTGLPSRQGQFVVGVCVTEYRNGVRIGEIKRDFQFNVVQCGSNVLAKIPVVDTSGASASRTSGVFIYQCQGFFVQFINQSINATTYYWDFGDPTTTADTSLAFQPSYTYPDSGVYRVQLIVNRGYPCADTTAVLVKIYPTFEADFNFLAGCANEPVVFSDQSSTTYGSIVDWSWDFGDGVQSTLPNPTHLYTQGGQFMVTLRARSDKGCSDSQTKVVSVKPLPQADFSFTPSCINTPVTFSDNSTITFGRIASRNWYFDGSPVNTDAVFTHTFSSLSTIQVTLISISADGCTDTVMKPVTIHPLPTATVRADTALCAGENVLLWARGGTRYQWQPPTGLNDPTIANPLATPAISTTYEVTVTDSNQCSDRARVTITVYPLPAADAGPDDYLCEGDSYQLNGAGGTTYLWSPGIWLNDSAIANPVASPTDTTIFVMTAFNQYGCQKKDSITLSVQHPILLNLDEDQDVCRGEYLTITASGGLYYQWLPAGGQPHNQGPSYTVSPPYSTTYTVYVSNDCFADTGFIHVTVHDLPFVEAGSDDSMLRDEFVYLNGTASGIRSYWTPPDGLEDPFSLSTRASPFNTITYMLTTISAYGCTATDSVRIAVQVINLLLIPTAFSPNGDGVNDVYKIIKTLNVEKLLDFKIFNRWGEIVFATQDISAGWDGTYKGREQEMGVYAFYIKALTRDGDIILKNGNITLVR
ncbi:MAG: hypothetical protein KatS3mg031_1430 [Chitinophagales bacterium]|nr:MAG: hypothetical protein KatS3mg031_1430 [Chitinophagales bacterium]